MKRLIKAGSAGFCFGVARAYKMAEGELSLGGCFCLGQLIHNDDVVRGLENRGLKTAPEVSSIPPNVRVIIRSHGIGKSDMEALQATGAQIIDATCPKVSHIQRIAKKAEGEGRQLIVVGEAEHPEVRAVAGWCAGAKVYRGADELYRALSENRELRDKNITMVFQTTQTKQNLYESSEIVKKLCTNIEIFDTICVATFLRQSEARELSASCDAVVVIGGKHSANSVHLAEICREYCDSVLFIANASELDTALLRESDTIGVTAGASVPEWIIKEVVQKMCDEIKIDEVTTRQTTNDEAAAESIALTETGESVNESVIYTEAGTAAEPVGVQYEEAEADSNVEKSFDEMLEDSIKTIYNGDTVSGIVAAITPTEISVDLGTKHSGYIPAAEFLDGQDANSECPLKIGDRIEAVVVRVNDVEGTIMLSKRRLDAIKGWVDIEAARESGETVEGIVSEENKGGVVVTVRGLRVFVPASQSGLAKDEPMSTILKTKVRLKITEVNRGRRRIIGSIRAVSSKERRERADKIWNEIEIGTRYRGVVKSLTSYGAFVDIGGIDGMIHVSELSWERIKQPSEIVSVGDEIEVYVIGFDKEKRKISLGYKEQGGNPWTKFTSNCQVGDIVKVSIVKLMPFGAFAEIMPGVDGLIHISQIANRRIGKPDEVLSVGDIVDVRITNIDNEKKKISLSIRALSEPAPRPERTEDEEFNRETEIAEGDSLVYEVSADGEATGNIPGGGE